MILFVRYTATLGFDASAGDTPVVFGIHLGLRSELGLLSLEDKRTTGRAVQALGHAGSRAGGCTGISVTIVCHYR